jgi:release factor glutamine methyltransferase
VLIPRADSETLLLAAQEHFGARSPAAILDLGTGPGTLLLAALDQWPAARGLGVDASEQALEFARRNAKQLGLADRATLRLGDWAEGVEGTFDLVLCNPPYIEEQAELPPDVSGWEPHRALFAGADGLDDYLCIARDLPRLVAPGGVACLELGAGQEQAVAALFAQTPFTISSLSDLRGIARCLVLRP